MLASTPPQAAPKWNHKVEDIQAIVKEGTAKTESILDQVASLDARNCTFDSVIRPMAEAENARNSEVGGYRPPPAVI